MAAGSQKFAWRQFPGVPRVCSACGRALRAADVARVHAGYASGSGVASTSFYCTLADCRDVGYAR